MTNTLAIKELPQQQENSRSTLKLLILLSIAIFALSLAAILIKLSEQDIGPNATVFNRFWIAAVGLGFWRGVKAIGSRLSRDSPVSQQSYTTPDLVLLLISALVMSMAQILWSWSLLQTNVANSNLLHNFTPIFAALGGWLLLGHYFDTRFIIGMSLAIGGAIAIGIQDLHIAANNLIGDGLALFSAVFYAANLLVTEKLRVKFPATSILLWSCVLRSVLMLPVVSLTEDRLFPSSLNGWLAVIALAVFCQVIGSGILAYSLKQFSSGFASLFLLLEPIITTILAWVIFAEHLSLFNLFAFFIVLVGIYLAKSGQGSAPAQVQIVAEDMATE
jgi:drug/metabolite transporter (DMT)-like permease